MCIFPLFQLNYRFSVYEHKIHNQNELASYRMIVLKNKDNRVVVYTGLEQFSFSYTGQLPRITVRQKAELVYICNALNHIFTHNRIYRMRKYGGNVKPDTFFVLRSEKWYFAGDALTVNEGG